MMATEMLEQQQGSGRVPQTIPGLSAYQPPTEELLMKLGESCANFLFEKFPGITTDIVFVNDWDPIALFVWIADVLAKTGMRLFVVAGTLVLLERLRRRITTPLAIIQASGHEIFFGACMIAHKYLEESSFTTDGWDLAAQHSFSKRRMSDVERAILLSLEHEVTLTTKELREVGIRVLGRVQLRDEAFV